MGLSGGGEWGSGMSMSNAFQLAVISALQANPELNALTGGEISQNALLEYAYPYISLGPSSFIPDNSDCITGREETIQVDCWDEDGGSLARAKQMVDLAYATLHEADLTLADPYAASDVNVVLTRCFLGPDNTTARGILQVTAALEVHRS